MLWRRPFEFLTVRVLLNKVFPFKIFGRSIVFVCVVGSWCGRSHDLSMFFKMDGLLDRGLRDFFISFLQVLVISVEIVS